MCRDTLAPIIGDVVHNLRSALDIMICELVVEASPNFDVKKVKFPFLKDVSGKVDAIKNANVNVAGSHVPPLIEAWQPFKGGASQLFALHHLDIADKRRSIIPTMLGAVFGYAQLAFAHEPELSNIPNAFPEMQKVYEGRILMAGEACKSLPPQGTRVSIGCALALDDVSGLPAGDVYDHELLECLERFIKITRGVLWSFEVDIAPEFETPKRRERIRLEGGAWQCPPEMKPEELAAWLQAGAWQSHK